MQCAEVRVGDGRWRDGDRALVRTHGLIVSAQRLHNSTEVRVTAGTIRNQVHNALILLRRVFVPSAVEAEGSVFVVRRRPLWAQLYGAHIRALRVRGLAEPLLRFAESRVSVAGIPTDRDRATEALRCL